MHACNRSNKYVCIIPAKLIQCACTCTICQPLKLTHPGSLQHVIGGDGLALLLPGAVVGARGQINDEYAARAGEDAGGILADVGAGGEGVLEEAPDARQRGFEFDGPRARLGGAGGVLGRRCRRGRGLGGGFLRCGSIGSISGGGGGR